MKSFALFCAGLVLSAASLLAVQPRIMPGGNAFVVYRDGHTFANGSYTLPQAMVVERPAVGTYLQGVVRVKTRARYGFHIGDRVINGSPVSQVLQNVGMNSVSSAFTATPRYATDAINAEQTIGLDRIYDVRYSDAIDPFDLCLRLMENPDVEYAVPIQIHKTSFVPNDPRYSQQAWLKTIKCEQAWDVTKGSKSVIIAIVDSGTDYTHEDLTAQIYTNPGETPGNSVDDDGNGLVDDHRGWDFVGNITIGQAQQGQLMPDNDPKVNYPTINGTNGHGTVTAGCASASTHNSKGIASPGYNCTLIPIKCGADNPNIGAILSGYPAIKYAADLGAHIINCSWGGTGTDPSAQDVIDYANAKGSLVVAASGNNGMNTDITPHNPANLEGVLSVGSTNNADQVSNFSNYGWGIDVLAPGEQVLSTFPNNGYRGFDGTSFSCPLTAGVCALIKTLHPTWTPQMIRQQIRSTSDQLSTVSLANRPLYYGRTNAHKAVTYNNSFSAGSKVPGITVTELNIPGGAISKYTQTTVKATLTNLLGDAPNTNVNVVVRSTGATVTPQGNQSLGDLLHDASKELSFDIQLQPTFPWFETDLELALTITSGSYTNYVLISVPVRLPTSNTHRVLAEIPYSAFGNIDFTSTGSMWATGYVYGTPAFIFGTESGGQNFGQTPYLATALSALSSSSAVIGGVQQGSAQLSVTSSSGANWQTTNASAMMRTVAYIKMFDATTGLAIGNPLSNKIGIAKTTTGGNSWTSQSNAPVVSSQSETVVEGSGCSLGDKLWFGTSNGRIIFTNNKGGSWNGSSVGVSGALIKAIAFKDENNGVALYATSSAANAPTKIASTTNGGLNWTKDVFDVNSLGIAGLSVFSPGGHHVLMGTQGEVFGSDNNGTEWQVILSKPTGELYCGFAARGNTNNLFQGGERISLLQYRYTGPNGTKILSTTTQLVDYGTITAGQNRQRYVTVESSGESDVLVSEVSITPDPGTPDTAFRVTLPLDDIIEPGTTDQLGIRFYSSSDTGTFGATATITSDATPATTTAKLTIRVQPTTSVDELTDVAFSMSPNPAHAETTLLLDRDAEASLYTSSGLLVGTWQLQQAVQQTIDLRSAAAGMYVLRITTAAGQKTYPLTIVR